MFRKISILLLAFCSLSYSFAQGYEDYSISWPFQDWVHNYGTVSGGGSVRLDIVDNVLTVRFDAGFQSAYVTSAPFELNTTRRLPDMTLGQINGGYTIQIRDGNLRAVGPQVPITSFGNKTFTQTLPHITITANKTGVCPDDPVTIARGSYYGITNVYDLKLEKSTWNGSSWTNFNYVDNPSPLDGSSIWAPKPTKRTRYRVKGDYAFNGGYSVYSNTVEVDVAKASLNMTYQGGTSTTFPDAPQGATVGFNLDLGNNYVLSSEVWEVNGNHVGALSSYTFTGGNPVTIRALVQSAELECSFYTNEVTITPEPHIAISQSSSAICPGETIGINKTSSYGVTNLPQQKLQKSTWNGSDWSNFVNVENPNPYDGNNNWNYTLTERTRLRVVGDYEFNGGYTVESNIVEVDIAEASLKMTYQGGTSTTFPDAPQGATVGFNLDLGSDYVLSSEVWEVNGNHVGALSSYTFTGGNPVTIRALVQSAELDCSFYTNEVSITPEPHIDIQVNKPNACPGDQIRITRTSSYGTTDLWNLRLQKSIWNESGWSNFSDIENPNPIDGGSIWNYKPEKRMRFKVVGEYAFELGYTVESNVLEVNSCNQIIARSLRFRNFTENSSENLSNELVTTTVQFYDGLGRLDQETAVMQSPDGHDIIVPHTYDGFGRETTQYLPYVDHQNLGTYRHNAIQDQLTFYQTAIDIPHTSAPFSERRFENSPLNRLLEQGSPGEAWQLGQASVSYDYLLNAADEVIQWDHSGLLTDQIVNYPKNQLHKNQTTDEDGNITNEYVDKQGRTILKESSVDDDWAKTYYIYDDFGLLRVVIPPEATSKLNTDFFATDADRQAFLNTWAFQYTYDARKRMSVKKVPGADPVYMVYDKWDRLALTQDGVQRINGKWLFTCYDELNRPVMSGILNDSRNRSQLQASVGSIGLGDTYRFLSFIGVSTNHGYNQNTYPFNNATGGIIDEVLSVTYYDNYDFKSLTSLSSINYVRPSEFEGTNVDQFHLLPVSNSKVKGLVTGTKTKVLDTDDYLTTITFYDDKYRALQIVSENYVGGIDVISNQYDFIGNIRRVKSQHSEASSSHAILIEYTYDHANRLLKCYHTLDSEDRIELYSNEYDQLGELITKNLHYSETDAGYIQRVDYEYNIRGWLRSINNASLSNTPDDPDPTDLFSLELIYNTPISTTPNN